MKRKRNQFVDAETGGALTAAPPRRTETLVYERDRGESLGSEDTDSDSEPGSDCTDSQPNTNNAVFRREPTLHRIAYPPRHEHSTTDARFVAWWDLVRDIANGADIRANANHAALLRSLCQSAVEPLMEPTAGPNCGSGLGRLVKRVAIAPGVGSSHWSVAMEGGSNLHGDTVLTVSTGDRCAATGALLVVPGARRWRVPASTSAGAVTFSDFCVNKPIHRILEAVDYVTHLPARLHQYVQRWHAAKDAQTPGGGGRDPADPARFEEELPEHRSAEYARLVRALKRAEVGRTKDLDWVTTSSTRG